MKKLTIKLNPDKFYIDDLSDEPQSIANYKNAKVNKLISQLRKIKTLYPDKQEQINNFIDSLRKVAEEKGTAAGHLLNNGFAVLYYDNIFCIYKFDKEKGYYSYHAISTEQNKALAYENFSLLQVMSEEQEGRLYENIKCDM